MRARIVLSTLYTTLILTGCIHVDRPPLPETEFTYDERDFIPSDVPLPKPEVNQRPNVGTKTMLVTVTHWQDGSLLNYELVKNTPYPRTPIHCSPTSALHQAAK